ncbi:SMI1/KNR4 family protein [Burkholderia seminalis]|uniref:SMI1/KNR4 family protein n=1 Tax=Burkholderia seminalis TaxID=488731 RepID=UPI0026549D07|nr:SMI1/KNR4 family protein [Burkholderia seminalis]MDN7853968.1 SMI1/KNR4 family protein [Burkholderia seminalis]
MSVPANLPAWLGQAYERCRSLVPGAMRRETVPVDDAAWRVTAEDVIAPDDVPSVPLAACDGYALRAADTAAASRREPVELDCELRLAPLASRTASPAARALDARQAAGIPAYVAMPAHADAVAPKAEHRWIDGNAGARLRFHAPLAAGQHVIAVGSEFRKGQVLLAKGMRITPARLAGLIAAGVRDVVVTKRPRIGVVIAGYDVVPPGHAREPWQRFDSLGPYLRAVLRQWGYAVPAAETLPLPSSFPCSPDTERDESAFKQQLGALSGRYDLIVGAGLPAGAPFEMRGLNAQTVYANDRETIRIRQTPGERFNVGRSDDRSPPTKWTVQSTRPDGVVYRTETCVGYDQAVLVNLPGHASGVAVLMHTIVPHVLDLLEHVAAPGPCWETAPTVHDIEPDAECNGMRWGCLSATERGESRVRLLPFQGDGPIRGVAEADALVAIPAGVEVLPAGTPVLFLRLDGTGARASHAGVTPDETANVPAQPRQTSPSPDVPVAGPATPDVREAWQRIERAIAAHPASLPGGLNGPADDHVLAELPAALGATLPDDVIDSLRLHDGQADPDAVFTESDALLGAQEIVAQWTIWRTLVSGGDFAGMTSEPDAGVRDDWYNLKWIPFTHDGSGNHLCIDLDPAQGGVSGQVIRVWHDDELRERVASSYAEWLARVAAERDGPAAD